MLLAGSAPTTGVSPFPDVSPIDGVVYDIVAAGPTQGCHFEDGRSAFKQYLSIIDTPGTYILEFLVSDQGNADHLIDTGLLIDNVRLTPEIDLAVTKTADPNPALAGETLFYNITVNNYGSGVARDVVVTDVLPPDAVYVADTNVPACVQAPVGTLTCQLGNMNGGTSKTFSIRTSLKADTRSRDVLTLANSVHVEAATPDRDLSNNDFTLRTTVNDRADLKVTKLSIPDQSIQAGETFAYQIYVDNLGPSYARNVTIADDILASGQFTLVSIAPDPARAFDTCTTAPLVGTPMPARARRPRAPARRRRGAWSAAHWAKPSSRRASVRAMAAGPSRCVSRRSTPSTCRTWSASSVAIRTTWAATPAPRTPIWATTWRWTSSPSPPPPTCASPRRASTTPATVPSPGWR
jgi:uncharacterized repeat protein (TIGR01451 family)